MDFGLIYFEVLTSTNPDLYPYLTIFNYFFSLMLTFGMIGVVVGWIFRCISRS